MSETIDLERWATAVLLSSDMLGVGWRMILDAICVMLKGGFLLGTDSRA